jgi:hypothetical protein
MHNACRLPKGMISDNTEEDLAPIPWRKGAGIATIFDEEELVKALGETEYGYFVSGMFRARVYVHICANNC